MMKGFEISPHYWLSRANVSPPFFFAPVGISTFPVVSTCLTKPKQSTEFWPSTGPKLNMIEFLLWVSFNQGISTTMVTALLTTPPWGLVFFKNVWIILSCPPAINALPLFFVFMALLGDGFWDLSFVALLAAVFQKFLLYSSSVQGIYWIKAFLFPFSPAYRLILKWSTSVNLV